ncbi:YbaK/EbsC family protein [Neisseria sp. Ec49-e6-T10]|uniref:YbaK/EbsC family protein n=1 Tax=Neisseria sp. Ec49-e6-T10 TaxID=3140744 RepID=UPI003EC11C36
MALADVKAYFAQYKKEQDIIIMEEGASATVQMAAVALGVEPARIAKTLAFSYNNDAILIVAAGDAKVDNTKFKNIFGIKAKMLSVEQVSESIGHEAGGVCPFALKNAQIKVYLDESLKRFQTVFPACGSSNSAIELTCDQLYTFAQSHGWVDTCKNWQS